MSREIKFRAWETKEKRMLHCGSFNISLHGDGNYGINHHFLMKRKGNIDSPHVKEIIGIIKIQKLLLYNSPD